MAVLDKYIDSNISGNVVNKLLTSLAAGHAKPYLACATFEVAAADDDGSVYRVFKSLDPNIVPLVFLVINDAITSGTDYDIGFYKPDLGAVIDKDALADGLDLSSGHTASHLSALSGIVTVDPANVGKTIYELAGHDVTTRLEGYDLAVTANTVGSAAGTITLVLLGAQG